jgi:hypothetical protein
MQQNNNNVKQSAEMSVCLDYDNVYQSNPPFWNSIIKSMRKAGAHVYVATEGHSIDGKSIVRQVGSHLGSRDDILFTDGQNKQQWARSNGLTPSAWIDGEASMHIVLQQPRQKPPPPPNWNDYKNRNMNDFQRKNVASDPFSLLTMGLQQSKARRSTKPISKSKQPNKPKQSARRPKSGSRSRRH